VIRVLLARVAVYRQRAIDDDVKPNRVARHVYVALTSQKAAPWSGTVQTVRALIRDAEVAGFSRPSGLATEYALALLDETETARLHVAPAAK
jgi:hypothetical protein